MFKILKKQMLNDTVCLMEFESPLIANKIKPGQFIILRIDEKGERIPFTTAMADKEKGSITIIFQLVGKTTNQLATLNEGDSILDLVGPLGMETELDGIKKAAVVGGGLGCAIAYPLAKELHSRGSHVDIIAGFRTKDLIILEDAMKKASTNLFICTDDGSYGTHGFGTDVLKKNIEDGADYDAVIAVGPVIMMKMVSELTKKYGIKTIVSMNPIMIDGTGMCGCCRVTVGGESKFACVDGPDFDGHEVDFDGVINRLKTYKKQERESFDHYCRMLESANEIKNE